MQGRFKRNGRKEGRKEGRKGGRKGGRKIASNQLSKRARMQAYNQGGMEREHILEKNRKKGLRRSKKKR